MSTVGVSLDLVRELRAICGEEHVTEHASQIRKSSPGDTVDRSEIDTQPAAALCVHPASADEVAEILRLANQRGFRVTPVGGGSDFYPSSARSEVRLHTDRLTQVEHYDPADLTVGIGAGTTVAQLNALVNPDKLMFACDPPLPEFATVGGILAAASQGPLRHGYGALRDFCIGIRFVTGDGRKAKGGGRVVKNVAGYDLMKLLIGSYGTLAIITSASFKLFPTPRQTRTFIAEFATWQEALKFRDLILRSPLAPMSLELVSPRARRLMRPEMTDDAWVICVRGAGSDAVLARYRKELGSAVSRELEGDKETEMWRAIEDFPVTDEMKKGDQDRLLAERVLARISITVPPAEIAAVLAVLERISDPQAITFPYIGRVGLGHLLVTVEYVDFEAPDLGLCLERDPLPPSAQVRGMSQKKWFAQGTLAAMRAVKQALDANKVLCGREWP